MIISQKITRGILAFSLLAASVGTLTTFADDTTGATTEKENKTQLCKLWQVASHSIPYLLAFAYYQYLHDDSKDLPAFDRTRNQVLDLGFKALLCARITKDWKRVEALVFNLAQRTGIVPASA